MRPIYKKIKIELERIAGNPSRAKNTKALPILQKALKELERLPPEPGRNILLAYVHLHLSELLVLKEENRAHHWRQGLSYARLTRDPAALAFAVQLEALYGPI